ncbi:hypothetical protein CTA2_10892 [Colletotrichum tanaceti]|uniref:Uncharacterized protein n=1 Tax=Colletotrichum tanaceti TaxID=1306861 RepID=A0A4U6XD25_9PEZI|nr:hypothetical protein CTA2_10892 [Colletotrichum tanaceti]TKW51727.1 hypothetical protein CTA1_9007 [Colletotrichum tanaceti]
MQFSIAIGTILSAMAIQTALATRVGGSILSREVRCYAGWKRVDCCWGKGVGSCTAQYTGTDSSWCSFDDAHFCRNVMRKGTNTPVSETCDADCCDTTTGHGIPCPR